MLTARPQPDVAASTPLTSLLQRAQLLPPARTAVVDPIDSLSLGGALAAADRGLIIPVLIGEEAAILQTAHRCGWSLQGAEIRPAAPGTEEAVAAHLAADGIVDIIGKGALHSDSLLHAILAEPRIMSGRRLSHVVVTEAPGRSTPLLLSDGAVNIAPTLDQKREIVQNAVSVAHAIGIERPRVAILAAVESVVSGMRTTLDAAALTEMARRGQIAGAIVDGPLALDDALDPAAATTKGIASPVAGRADILVSPDLEAANILYKAFDVLLRARFGAVVVGATVPIVFTSRADSVDARVVSCAIARLLCAERC